MYRSLSGLVIGLLLTSSSVVRGDLAVSQIAPAQAWKPVEFRVANVPPADNPFDPDQIRVDATFTTSPSNTVTVPAFWYQPYTRAISSGTEVVQPTGSPEWRVRFTPTNSGDFQVRIEVRTNDAAAGTSAALAFSVSAAADADQTGYVAIAPGNQYFQTGDGKPLRLIGHNVCWHHARGTADYDEWFGAMAAAGENVARLWMWPFGFGLECEKNTLTHYRLDRAWQLDYVVTLAEQKGIYLLLCLDYHGMFEQKPDYWGGNNHWTNNPYNPINGGPAATQNAFFTDATARTAYQKRLRYLVARYGYSPNLLAWEFFNEIDNVYAYLKPNDVAAWHQIMGEWLGANDPFGHLVTTSLTGNSDRPEIWSVPALDFSMYHSYNEPSPAMRLAEVTQSFLTRYGKPVLIGEFGVDWRGWSRTSDPYLRGFRQALWGGALGGSAGSAMSWWWEAIHSENAYPLFSSMSSILKRTAWASGNWSKATFLTSGLPPATVSDPLPSGTPFAALLTPSGGWGTKPSGRLAVADTMSAGYAATTLNCFVHGSAHGDLRVPFILSAWLTNNARLLMHLNSVSQGAILTVNVDGTQAYRTNLTNLDGGYQVNNEYNLDLVVNLPAGKHSIQIQNPGTDWFYLDWVRLEQVIPSAYANNWQPSPDAIGLRRAGEAIVYATAPVAAYPAGATNAVLPLQEGQFLRITNWPAGEFIAEWFDPVTGVALPSTRGTSSNQVLNIALPAFREDVTGVISQPPVLQPIKSNGQGAFHFKLNSTTLGEYLVEVSSNLWSWNVLTQINMASGEAEIAYPMIRSQERAFFRAKRVSIQ